jgi:peptide/nickel transport system substrate-binding protein
VALVGSPRTSAAMEAAMTRRHYAFATPGAYRLGAPSKRSQGMEITGDWTRRCAAGLCVALIVGAPALAGDVPKRGGTLNYVIPTDAPPSFDAHRETTYATIHSAAPFYSVLIRVNPQDPGSTTDFVCDLCTEMPTPTEDGKTYSFKIRQGVKFHDGSPLTAADVAASWEHIIFSPEGVLSPRESHFMMVDKVEATDAITSCSG